MVSIVCITSFAFHRTHPFGYSPATNFHIVVWKHAESSVHAPDCYSENQVSTLFHRFERLILVPRPKIRTYLNSSVTQALSYGAFSNSIHEGVVDCASWRFQIASSSERSDASLSRS